MAVGARLQAIRCVAVILGFGFASGAGAADLLSPAPVATTTATYSNSPPDPGFFASAVSNITISEARVGAFLHDPKSPEKGSTDANVEFLFGQAGRKYTGWDALVPRFSFGGTANFAGKTSQAYAGLTWTYDVTSLFFVEGSFGGSVNNGIIQGVPGRNDMGCNVTFRESATGGVHITSNINLMATVEHMSNAGFCVKNRGLTNVGVRVGYVF